MRKIITISPQREQRAGYYAHLSHQHTTEKHNFHDGSDYQKWLGMFKGKLGEEMFKVFLEEENIYYQEDPTTHKQPDNYDFLVSGYKLDVKTATGYFKEIIVDMVHQVTDRPKDIYILTFLNLEKKNGSMIGWVTREKLLETNLVKNHGHHNNYCMPIRELGSMEELVQILKRGKYVE